MEWINPLPIASPVHNWRLAVVSLRRKFVSASHHWGQLPYIYVSKLTTNGSDNGLWTLWTNFSEILSEIHTFSFMKMHLKISPGKWQPFCLGLNMLRRTHIGALNLVKLRPTCLLLQVPSYQVWTGGYYAGLKYDHPAKANGKFLD